MASSETQVWFVANVAIAPIDAPKVGVSAMKMQNSSKQIFLNHQLRITMIKYFGIDQTFFLYKMTTRRRCFTLNMNAKSSLLDTKNTIKQSKKKLFLLVKDQMSLICAKWQPDAGVQHNFYTCDQFSYMATPLFYAPFF